MKRILVPTDGSDTARAALTFAAELARAEGAAVIVVSVAERAVFYGAGDETVTEAITGYAGELVRDAARVLSESGVHVETMVVESGQPDEGILQAAMDSGADLIVMGTHGRTGLARAVVGSVADRVLRHSKIPMVFVPLISPTSRDGDR